MTSVDLGDMKDIRYYVDVQRLANTAAHPPAPAEPSGKRRDLQQKIRWKAPDLEVRDRGEWITWGSDPGAGWCT
jgi:hypothetical protein